MHRKLLDGDVYFVANASNRAVAAQASVRVAGRTPEWWDPFTGETSGALFRTSDERTVVELRLAPYESRVLLFSKATGRKRAASEAPVQTMDLSTTWDVTFTRTGRHIVMDHLRSWTNDEETRFYSGEAVYEKRIQVPSVFIQAGSKIVLDFGPGSAVEAVSTVNPGMRALLESPVRESAIVFVNGQRAGAVWRPPFEIDIARYLHPGKNVLRIAVQNLAINEMAGKALPDYRLLNLRYGERFVPQDMQDVKPLPAGILGPVQLQLRPK